MALETLVTDRGVLVDIGDGVLRRASIDGKTAGDVLLVDSTDPVGVSFQSSAQTGLFDYVASGEDPGSGITSFPLKLPAGLLGSGYPGVPVAMAMVATEVAVSWMSGNTPTGPWVATLERRSVGGVWTAQATFSIPTS